MNLRKYFLISIISPNSIPEFFYIVTNILSFSFTSKAAPFTQNILKRRSKERTKIILLIVSVPDTMLWKLILNRVFLLNI